MTAAAAEVAGMRGSRSQRIMSLAVTCVQNSRIILGKYLNVKLITHINSPGFVVTSYVEGTEREKRDLYNVHSPATCVVPFIRVSPHNKSLRAADRPWGRWTTAWLHDHLTPLLPASSWSVCGARGYLSQARRARLAGKSRQAGTGFTRHQRPAPGACRTPLFQLATNGHERCRLCCCIP